MQDQPQPTPPPQTPDQPGAQLPPVAPPAQPATPPPAAPTPPTPSAPQGDHVSYQAEATPTAKPAAQGAITWEASEYVHNAKGGFWLIGFLVIIAVLVGVAVWLGAWTFVALILVAGLAMGVFAFRPPHVVHYTLDDAGVHIGDKTYFYHDFRAFGVLQDGAFYTMTLIPIKRFAPALSVYFAEDQGEQIVDIVGEHLPMEDIRPDLVDSVMRRLRF